MLGNSLILLKPTGIWNTRFEYKFIVKLLLVQDCSFQKMYVPFITARIQ